MRRLARRLLAVEAENARPADAPEQAGVRVIEKLHIPLTRFTGADGCASLLRRSLALARKEVPSLSRITLGTNCKVEGLETLAEDGSDKVLEAAAALTAHLLGLLVTFIGEPLTLRLVRDAWPDQLPDE